MGAAPPTKPIPLRELIAESPLVPVAAAATIGLIVDRYFGISPIVAMILLAIGGIGAIALARRNRRMSIAATMLIVGALGAIYHHNSRFNFESDDIGNIATIEPQLIHLRGVLDAEPTIVVRPPPEGLSSYLSADPTRSVLRAREILTNTGWAQVSAKRGSASMGRCTIFMLGMRSRCSAGSPSRRVRAIQANATGRIIFAISEFSPK